MRIHNIHASCVGIGSKGVLILGASGSGKSDLALRLIDAGAKLVADDRVDISKQNGKLIASAPKKIKGMLEIRGVGIVKFPAKDKVTLKLAVSLVARSSVERMPEPQFFDCEGGKLPLLSLHSFDHSTPAKIRATLESA
jgi:serine kinase of HPr protein (carbohydrate metabolism regulator)